jgi:vacuolar-type H+-ATPase subunit E/Vma4
MALQDIFDAIKAETDERIAAAQAKRDASIQQMRDAAEQFIAQRRRQIAERKEQDMRQIREKAESHARMVRNNTLLAKKQECMEQLYHRVLEDLSNLPLNKTEVLLKKCLSLIGQPGVIYPAKPHEALLAKLLPDGCTTGAAIGASGGFRFSSDTKEYDFTYEFIVNSLILPQSEVQVANELFPSVS